jgi:hypothetical protein
VWQAQLQSLRSVTPSPRLHHTRQVLVNDVIAESYKKECQEKNLPSSRCRSIFFLGIQPNCLNVHSYSESGLPQAEGFVSSPRVKRRINCSSLWFHFAVVTTPIVFLKHNKPNRCPPDEWQHMVLSETRGRWLCSIVREGIGLNSETRARKARAWPRRFDTSSRNRASQEPDGHRREMVPRDETDSQPEALKLLVVVSNSWRRNVPPSSTRSR